MAGKQVQRRRGTTAQHAVFTGAFGEVTVDTDRMVEVVHDGSTVGGFPQASLRDVASTNLSVTAAQNTANAALNNAATADAKAVAAQNTANTATTKANTAQAEVDALEVTVNNAYATSVKQDSATSVAKIPKGTNAQRPGAPSPGDFRFNTDLGRFEGYANDTVGWAPVGGDSIPLFTVFWVSARVGCPAGFVVADGQVLPRATYPDAYAGYVAGLVPQATEATWLSNPAYRGCYTAGDGSSTFRVPDLNGKAAGSWGAMHLRGDGILSAQTDGIMQSDAFQAHTHTMVNTAASGGGASAYQVTTGSIITTDNLTLSGLVNLKTHTQYLTDPTGGPAKFTGESRPLNVTGCWCIKLFGAVINPGSANMAQLASDVANLQANKADLNKSNNYSGAALRFYADFSSPVGSLNNRYLFQSSTVNGQTFLGMIPNGSGNGAGVHAFATANPEQSQRLNLYALTSACVVSSERTGAAGYVPLMLQTGGITRVEIDASGITTFKADNGGGYYGTIKLASQDGVSFARIIRMFNDKSIRFLNQALTQETHIFRDNGDVYCTGALRSTNQTAGGDAALYRVRDATQSTAVLAETETGVSVAVAYLVSNGQRTFGPQTDGVMANGWALARWSAVYAVTGAINTSDQREKTEVRPFSPEELAVAQALAGDIGMYQWLAVIDEKGPDAARLHAGMTAQNVQARFAEQGLDATAYGLFCYDTWEAADATLGPDDEVFSPAREAGDRYGLRYEELNQFILRGLLENQRSIESRLAALEAAP